jgi:glycosyltransferase involved in cell wall biosynthesis
MNILMMTNTYLPHVGGVARSVGVFTDEYRRRGHRVIVVAPEYKELPREDLDTIRIPAIQNFNGSDFSVVLPVPGFLQAKLRDFKPDVIHSHHPFLIGSTALRIASKFQVPLVYTHHTLFEEYLHYVPVDLPLMKTFVINLSSGYANLADHVIAPSQSVADFLLQQKVTSPVSIIPTGVDIHRFERGNGRGFRQRCGISEQDYIIGHVGRLAAEKNLSFLAEAVSAFMQKYAHVHFVVVGGGPWQESIEQIFAAHKTNWRLHMLGKLEGQDLVDAYHSMDVFAFSSKSETQGLVLVEAMAAGTPVVALEASGVRDVLRHRENGCMLTSDTADSFVEGLEWVYRMSTKQRNELVQNAKETARRFSIQSTADQALHLYEQLSRQSVTDAPKDDSLWHTSLEQIKAEWEVFANFSSAVTSAIQGDQSV